MSEQPWRLEEMSALAGDPSLPTLYWANGSIPSWQVLFLLAELKLPFQGHRLKLMSSRETQKPEFLALNPRGQAPLWVEPDGWSVRESLAILFVLCERTQARHLLGADDLKARALIMQRLFEVERLRAAYRPLERLFLGEDKLSTQDHTLISAALTEALPKELSLWESALSEAPYAAAHQLTLTDVVLYPSLAYMVRRGLELEPYPALHSYVQRLRRSPAGLASHPVGWERPAKRNLFRQGCTLSRLQPNTSAANASKRLRGRDEPPR